MKTLICLGILLLSFTLGHSQVRLDLCTGVEPNGYCDFRNTKFITTPDSTRGKIFMKVTSSSFGVIGANNIFFKIYRIDDTGNEKLVNMLQQAIQPDWRYAYMPYFFDSPGKYDVKVYNEADSVICTNAFELITFK